MGPKRQQNPDDKLAVILVANSAARALPSCQIMKELLQEAVESESSKISGLVKLCYDDTLSIYEGCPSSLPVIQWITKVKDESRWKTEPFFLVLVGSNSFDDIARSCRTSENMLGQIFQLSSSQKFDFLGNRQARIVVYDERKRPNGSKNPEVKRLEDKKAFNLVTGCEALANVSFVQGLKPDQVASLIVRASRSVLDAVSKDDYDYVVQDPDTGVERVNWYPKKSGPPAQVTKNDSHTGLHLLWQKHLQQISKRVGIEQAKVIASDPSFQSPTCLFDTFRRHGSAGETLLQSKQTRPSGSSRDIASLGSGQCLGPDISKKVHTMFTVKGDGLTFLQDN